MRVTPQSTFKRVATLKKKQTEKCFKIQVVLTDFHALEGGVALAVTSTGDIGGGGV